MGRPPVRHRGAWPWVPVGFVVTGLFATEPRIPEGDVPRPPPESFHPAGEPDGLDGLAPRELRAIEGVGDRRAVALARARWNHGRSPVPFDPESVDGVGPATAEAIAEWLGERGRASPEGIAGGGAIGDPAGDSRADGRREADP